MPPNFRITLTARWLQSNRHAEVHGLIAEGASRSIAAFDPSVGIPALTPTDGNEFKALRFQRRGDLLRLIPTIARKPETNGTMLDGSGTLSPLSENVMSNVGAGWPPTMSVPIRSQSGAKNWSRVQACKSVFPGGNGVPGGTIGLGAESQ